MHLHIGNRPIVCGAAALAQQQQVGEGREDLPAGLVDHRRYRHAHAADLHACMHMHAQSAHHVFSAACMQVPMLLT